MSLLRNELNKNKKSLISFTLVMCIIAILTFLFYPSVYNNRLALTKFINKLPKGFKLTLGINLKTCFTPLGYYAIIFIIISLVAGLFAIYIGFNNMSYDKRNTSHQFYYIKPIKRTKIVSTKTISIFISLLISNLVYHLCTIIMVLLVKTNNSISLLTLFQINSSLFLLESILAIMGMLIGVIYKNSKTSIIPSLIIWLVFVIIMVFEKIFALTLLQYINPLSYFTVTDIINTGKYQYRFVTISVFILFFLYSFIVGIYENEEILD